MPGTGGQSVCSLDDRSSCPRTSPSRLTPLEVRAIEDMVTSPDYRHARPARSPRCPATRQGLGLTLNLVPARPAKKLALAPAAPASPRERKLAHTCSSASPSYRLISPPR